MSYRLIDSNAIANKSPEVNDMPCVYADLPNGLDGSFITQHWTPVTDGLPDVGKYVIASTSWHFVKQAMYCGDHWEIDGIDYKITSVLAWMPLPMPWKGEDDNVSTET